MRTPDPQSVEGLFLAALAHASPQERESFLNEACGDDAERRRRVEALLRAYDDAGSFLEHPPVNLSGTTSFNLDFLTPSDDPGLLGLLGPYEIYEVLGRGGMGIVFRARDPKLNRVVAIKVLAPELAANPLARRRFLREAQAAAAISHPHVVTIHAVDEGVESRESRVQSSQSHSTLDSQYSTLPYLVMECIVGQTLQQKLDKQGSLRLTETLRIGQQLASGLAAAHKQGLIHRDIKPANVLLENGIERVKITDFGLARLVDDVSITRTGEVSGTPQYMSPEQAAGDPVDHRSDLFSLGCVLYAMCTGRSPFRATSLAAAIRRVCDDTPRPIEEINPEAPVWLIGIINQLLEKNPDDRVQSAEEVAEVLGERLAAMQDVKRTSQIDTPITWRHVAPALERSKRSVAKSGADELAAPYRRLAWFFVMIATGSLTFAAARLIEIEPHIVTMAAIVFGVLPFLILVNWWSKGVFANVNRFLVALLYVVAFWIGGISGSPNGENWFGAPRGPLATIWGVLIGASALLGAWAAYQFSMRYQVGRYPREQTRPSRQQSKPEFWRKSGRKVIWGGVGLFPLPLLLLVYGYFVGDRYDVTFVVQLFILAAILGVLMIMIGCVTLLMANAVGERQGTPPLKSSQSGTSSSARSTTSPKFGWVIISGLALIPLLMLVSLGSYLLAYRQPPRPQPISGEELRRHLQERDRAENSQRNAQQAEAEWLAMRQREWEEAATATFRFDPTVLGSVGLALYRSDVDPRSAMDDVRPGELIIRAENRSTREVFDAGQVNEIKLPPGTYHLWVHGKTFGWSRERQPAEMEGMMGAMGGFAGMRMEDSDLGMAGMSWPVSDAAVSRIGTFDITDDPEPETHALAYDWQDIASRPPQPYSFHRTPRPRFYWNADAYDLDPAQGEVVQKLLVAFAAGSPEVRNADLTVRIHPFDTSGMSALGRGFEFGGGMSPDGRTLSFVEAVFQNGQHPAWGTLIIPGETEGTYRLAPPQLPPPAGKVAPDANTEPPPSDPPESSPPPATDSTTPEPNNDDSPPPPPLPLDKQPATEKPKQLFEQG